MAGVLDQFSDKCGTSSTSDERLRRVELQVDVLSRVPEQLEALAGVPDDVKSILKILASLESHLQQSPSVPKVSVQNAAPMPEMGGVNALRPMNQTRWDRRVSTFGLASATLRSASCAPAVLTIPVPPSSSKATEESDSDSDKEDKQTSPFSSENQSDAFQAVPYSSHEELSQAKSGSISLQSVTSFARRISRKSAENANHDRFTRSLTVARMSLGTKSDASSEHDIDDLKEYELKNGFMFHPHALMRVAWDSLVAICATFSTVTIPLVLVYLELEVLKRGALADLLHVTDAIWIANIVVNFLTGFYAAGRLEMDPWKVAVRYARRCFVLDMLAAWPFTLTPSEGEALWFICALKVPRALRVNTFLAKLAQEYRFPAVLPVKMSLIFFCLSHVLACIWRVAQHNDIVTSISDTPWWDLYVEDMYWVLMTITTVGFGDIHPISSGARLYAIAVMCIASAFIGSMISVLAHYTRGMLDDEIENKVAQAADFMRRRRVPRNLQRRVRNNLRHLLRHESVTSMDPELLGLLSPAVQSELSLALLSSTVMQFPLFMGANRAFVAEIAQAHTGMRYFPGDLVAVHGQAMEEVVFIIQGRLISRCSNEKSSIGRCSITSPGSNNAAFLVDVELTAGAWFGEACLFESDKVIQNTYVAVAESELAVLASREYARIIQRYPKLLDRHKSIEQGIKDGNVDLTELEYIGSTEVRSSATESNWVIRCLRSPRSIFKKILSVQKRVKASSSTSVVPACCS